MSYNQEGNGLGTPTSGTPAFQAPGTYQRQPQPAPPQWQPAPPQWQPAPPQWQPAPPQWQPVTPYYVSPAAPPRSNSKPLVITIVLICVFMVTGIGFTTFRLAAAPKPTVPVFTMPTPVTMPTIVIPSLEVPSIQIETGWQPDPPAGTPYMRDRETLTDAESAYYGNLKQGDCLLNRPPESLKGGVPTLACTLPHTYQVAGFVDLSEGMPDYSDGINFEMALSRRCNSLKATLSVPPALKNVISINYPDQAGWNDGIAVALCWVASSDPWVGSVIDGTAAPS